MDWSKLMVWLVAFLVILGGNNHVLADIDFSFPNIFRDIIGKRDRLRFQYEINVIDDRNESRVNSALVDESYSFQLNTGRILVDDGGLRGRAYQYEMFYWIKTDEMIESFMLHPFICTSYQTKVEDSRSPFGAWILANFIPNSLTYLFEAFNLGGISALMANAITHYGHDLRRTETGESGTGEVAWMLDTQTEYSIEFRFTNSIKGVTLNFEDSMADLRVTIFRSHRAQNDKVVARLTVLKTEYEFDLDILELPEGYSCRRALEPPKEIKYHNYVPSLRTKYTYLVSLTIETDLSGILRAPKYRDRFSVMKPIESISKPKFSSSHVVLLHDRFERALSIMSGLNPKPDNNETAKKRQSSSLNVWDFNTHLRYLVDQRTCEQPVRFESTLFGGKTSSFGCKSEAVEFPIGARLSLRLNQDTLNYVLFAIQDRKNYAQLIDVNRLEQVSADGFDYELIYEMPVSDSSITKCLASKDAAGQEDFHAVRLVTKYLYSVVREEWRPAGSSMMFFDETHRKLMLQIDLSLLELEPYNPWKANHHLLDLSLCKLGLKQSARLELEFALANDLDHLKRVTNPHESFRAAMAGFLMSTYKLTLIRMPSIGVEIVGDSVRVRIQLLERESLLVDSERVAASELSQGEYLELLRNATRSSLLANQESCADYCQYYHCKVFVFCKLTSSCYIFSDSNATDDRLGPKLGSFQSLDLHCESYRISPARSVTSDWRRESWGLDEILESLVFAVNQERILADEDADSEVNDENRFVWAHRKQVSRPYIQITSYLSDSSISQTTLTLFPTYAHYTYDNLNGASLTHLSHLITSEDIDDNPFSSQKSSDVQKSAQVNFQIALSGFKFVTVRGNEQQSSVFLHHQHDLDHLDLETSDGYLVLDEVELEDCIRICLNDLACSSFSHCATEQSQCIITQFNRTGIIELLYSDDADHGVSHSRAPGLFDGVRLAEDARCSIMRRTYSDQFEKFETRMLSSYPSDQSMEDVVDVVLASSAEDCATSCVLDRVRQFGRPKSAKIRQPCLSYDFCRSMSSKEKDSFAPVCVLFKRHLISSRASAGTQIINDGDSKNTSDLLISVLQNNFNYSLNSFCSHYVRNFLYDFHKINMRKLAPNLKSLEIRNYANDALHEQTNSSARKPIKVNTEIVEDISLTNCAQFCEEDPDCGAFEYCIGEHPEAPKGLLLVCSLGTNETLRMAPVRLAHKGEIAKKRYATTMLQLVSSNACSVYTYKSLSLILGHKRKNSNQIGDELFDELDRNQEVTIQSAFPHLKRFDLLIGLAFFIIGCAVRSVVSDQFGFNHLQDSSNHLIDRADLQANRWPIESEDQRVANVSEQRGESFQMETLRANVKDPQ